MQQCGFVRLYVSLFLTGVKEQSEMQHYGFIRLYVYTFFTGVKGQRDAALWVC